mgnify:CR=1 FL=1
MGGADEQFVPGGFGERGTEGMIAAAKYARERKVPYLGICLGMQMAVVEAARNLAGIPDAGSEEFDHEAGAGPEHIVRLTWYLTSRSEYEAAGAGIGAAWKETLGRNFPPSTLLYIDGLVDQRAKVEIEVTAFVPAT